jgi:ABC-type nitrate/sulfonate/bicarbonate transport system ATPase subunit
MQMNDAPTAAPVGAGPVSSTDLLAVRQVNHCYLSGDVVVEALADIELHVASGEFVVILGPSGCGKTTLLRLIAGFQSPSNGEILVDGHPSHGPNADRGVVFQQPTLYPWLSVRENVEFGPRMRGVDRAARRQLADEYLKRVGLEGFEERAPYELSGGMQQRVAIARVLINKPALLLMDEPFGALDALTREVMQDELLRIWREEGATVIFITHSVDEAIYLGTRVLVLSKRPGRIALDRRFGFSAKAVGGEGRYVRATQAFGQAREELLSAILG